MHITKARLAQILKQNEGARFSTEYKGNNFRCCNDYHITGGEVLCRESGRSSWADSRFDHVIKCTPDQIRRLIHRYPERFNLKGID